MLTKQEELNTAHELQENFSRLNSDLQRSASQKAWDFNPEMNETV